MIRGRSFGRERVLLDGAHYVDCSFEGTIFVYFGGKVPELHDCRLKDVEFVFEGPAKNTLTFVEQLKAGQIGFAFNPPPAQQALGAQA